MLQLFKRHGYKGLVEASDLPNYVETIRPIYEPEEIAALLRNANPDEASLIKFCFTSGFRDREIRYVTWRDVDYRNSVVRVTARPIWKFKPKNYEERAVPLPGAMIEQLQQLRAQRDATPTELAFPNSKGKPNSLHIEVVKDVAHRAKRNCGQCVTKHDNWCAEGPYCQRFYLHKFRHTFATEHLRHGIDVRTLQSWMKEASLVFVRAPAQSQFSNTPTHATVDAAPVLEMTPGARIEAKLETQISSAVQAPVVAVVEYTYAIGDRIVVPAGTRVYRQLQQADRSGFVGVKFDEIELLDGQREKIETIGAELDLGPIKGTVYGKNTGKNFLIKATSGVGSLAAMLVGNNSSAALSEEDLLRERVADPVGNAGDSELMNLSVTSRVVVSVPADTKIYIVFTRNEESQAGLHRVAGQ